MPGSEPPPHPSLIFGATSQSLGRTASRVAVATLQRQHRSVCGSGSPPVKHVGRRCDRRSSPFNWKGIFDEKVSGFRLVARRPCLCAVLLGGHAGICRGGLPFRVAHGSARSWRVPQAGDRRCLPGRCFDGGCSPQPGFRRTLDSLQCRCRPKLPRRGSRLKVAPETVSPMDIPASAPGLQRRARPLRMARRARSAETTGNSILVTPRDRSARSARLRSA